MTREQLDAMEVLYIERNDSLDASSYSIPDLIAAAREALELREALEWIAKQDVVTIYEDFDGGYCCSVGCGAEEMNAYGSTPLEAINNARRGM